MCAWRQGIRTLNVIFILKIPLSFWKNLLGLLKEIQYVCRRTVWNTVYILSFSINLLLTHKILKNLCHNDMLSWNFFLCATSSLISSSVKWQIVSSVIKYGQIYTETYNNVKFQCFKRQTKLEYKRVKKGNGQITNMSVMKKKLYILLYKPVLL